MRPCDVEQAIVISSDVEPSCGTVDLLAAPEGEKRAIRALPGGCGVLVSTAVAKPHCFLFASCTSNSSLIADGLSTVFGHRDLDCSTKEVGLGTVVRAPEWAIANIIILCKRLWGTTEL